ncbi:hypothetical protein ACOJUR_12375 [Alicyclobacillus tolerans]|uniref:hypothetical protein n=1 Tax=Alicyclobacillus tolerans TaxID=90970 RepID=UPI003B7C50CB
MLELMQAKKELEVAENAFDWADEKHVDVAIYRLKAAELVYSTALKKEKEMIYRYGKSVEK